MFSLSAIFTHSHAPHPKSSHASLKGLLRSSFEKISKGNSTISTLFTALASGVEHKMDKIAGRVTCMGFAIKSGIGNGGNNLAVKAVRNLRRLLRQRESATYKLAGF